MYTYIHAFIHTYTYNYPVLKSTSIPLRVGKPDMITTGLFPEIKVRLS